HPPDAVIVYSSGTNACITLGPPAPAMMLHHLLFASLAALGFSVSAFSASGAAEGNLPHFRRQGTADQLIVDGRPYLILGGELLNSSSSSRAYMQPIWDRLVAQHLNTVFAGVSWELIEPEEGHFDFHTLDDLVADARAHHLRLVLLWFGSWKNGMSSYAPVWVKRDLRRFPRVRLGDGRT